MRPKRITRRKRSRKQNGQRQINEEVQTRATTIPKWSGKIPKRKSDDDQRWRWTRAAIGWRAIPGNRRVQMRKNGRKQEYQRERIKRDCNEKKCLCAYMNWTWALNWPLYFIKRCFSGWAFASCWLAHSRTQFRAPEWPNNRSFQRLS